MKCGRTIQRSAAPIKDRSGYHCPAMTGLSSFQLIPSTRISRSISAWLSRPAPTRTSSRPFSIGMDRCAATSISTGYGIAKPKKQPAG